MRCYITRKRKKILGCIDTDRGQLGLSKRYFYGMGNDWAWYRVIQKLKKKPYTAKMNIRTITINYYRQTTKMSIILRYDINYNPRL
jgi:hypothetical protein